MTKEQAEKILDLPDYYNMDDVEKAYRRQRDVYYPPLHELFSKRDEARIKEQMYEQMTNYTYNFLPQDPQNGATPSDKAQFAFVRFSDVCDAYHILRNDKHYKTYRLDPDDPDGYWAVRYGKAGAASRRKAAAFSRKTLWLLIPLLLAVIFAGTIENYAVCAMAALAFVALHWGIPFMLTPIDFLLYLPRGLWKGVTRGAEYGLLITKLYSIIVCSLGFLIWWIIKFIFRPCLILEDWELEFCERRDYTRRCKAFVPLRYARAKEQVEEFGKEFNMDDKLQKAVQAYQIVSKWTPEARENAFSHVEQDVHKENPQYGGNLSRVRSGMFRAGRYEIMARHEQERASKWIEWVSTDTYGAGPFVFSNRDDALADSMYEDQRVKNEVYYGLADRERMELALDRDVIHQRQILEYCVALLPMI